MSDVAGEINDQGDGFRYPVVVLSVPRRAGKTVTCLATGLDRMDVAGDVRAWYTAQRREEAAKQFRDEWCPMLEAPGLQRLYRLRRAQGSEGVHKRFGSSRLQLFPPTESGLHNTNADLVMFDEAWWFDVTAGETLEAGARPAQLTRPWRQLWIVSAGGTIESTWLDRWLCAGEAGTPGVALFDYGADADADDYDPGSPATWFAAHPTVGRGFPVDALEHQWHTKRDVASFERAYLNVWPRPSRVTAAAGLALGDWTGAARPELAPDPAVVLALDVAADRSSAAIAVAGVLEGGRVVVEVVAHQDGVAWLTAGVKAARARFRGVPVVADALVAASVVAELSRARVRVETVGARDHAQACGTFVDLLGSARLNHRSQAALDAAVTGAARRPLGDAWLWSRLRSTVDISPLVAVTLAAWWAHTRPATGRARVAVAAGAPQAPSGRNARTLGTTGPVRAPQERSWRV